MNEKKGLSMEMKDKISVYIIAPVIVFVTLYAVYAVKGIYPFGRETIDFYDMGQEVMAFYYHIYDYLHGAKVSFYDWYTALGMNMSAGTSGCSNYSIFNLYLLFVPRDKILESMSLFLAIKMMIMSVTFGFCLRTISPKTPYYIKLALGIGYAFSGYVMMHYTIMTWMDVAAVFPLIAAFLYILVQSGKITGYCLTLSLSFVMSYYLTVMILIYVFMIFGLYLICDRLINKNHSVKNIFQLGIGTFLAFGISMVVVLPHLMQTMSSTRYANNYSWKVIMSIYKSPYDARWWALLNVSFAFAVLVVGIVRDVAVNKKKSINRIIPIVCTLFIACAELFFENVNMILHFGSYVQYPIRNGFLIYFTVAIIASYYASRDDYLCVTDAERIPKILEKIRTLASKYCTLISIAIVAFSFVFSTYMIWQYRMFDMNLNDVVKMTMKIMLVFTALYILLVLVANKGISVYACSIMIMIEAAIYAFVFVGPISFSAFYMTQPEQTAEYVRISNEASELFDIGQSYTDRIKNPDESLNTNYGFVIKRPTLSNMTHLVSEDAQQGAAKLGYSIHYTRLLDAGGTAFTDALLHIKNTLSSTEQDKGLYEELGRRDLQVDHITGEKRAYYYYENKYTLPFGVVVPHDDLLDVMANAQDFMTFNNFAYAAVLNGLDVYNIAEEDKAIIEELKNSEFVKMVSAYQGEDIEFTTDGRKVVYFWGACADQAYMNLSINVNGNIVGIPTIGATDNELYPTFFNNGTICLGTYDNEKVKISFENDSNILEDEGIAVPDYLSGVFTLNLDALEKVCSLINKYSDVDVNISGARFSAGLSGKAGYDLLVPITYDDGFTTTNNGGDVDSSCINGLFTAIPLTDGNNDIQMKYLPQGLKLGCVISIISIVLLIVILILQKRMENIIAILNKVLAPMYGVAFIVLLFGIYIVPAIWCTILRIKG